MNNSVENFVDRLKAWRTQNHYSQEKAAVLLEIDRAYLSQIESGKRRAGPKVINNFNRELAKSKHALLADRAEESQSDYRFLKKVIHIQQDGTDEQRALLAAFVDSICDRLDLPRSPDQSAGTDR